MRSEEKDMPRHVEERLSREGNSNYCIFEKRLCMYAQKEGNSFQCTAPSDAAMPCYK